jgi:hypothetical protein
MDERLRKQWDVARGLLQLAASEIASADHQQKFADLAGHSKLELALDLLEKAASEQEVSVEFWWRLTKVAEALGLAERRKSLQARCQERRRR